MGVKKLWSEGGGAPLWENAWEGNYLTDGKNTGNVNISMHKATTRGDHRVEDCWDLTPLCASVEQWEKDAAALEIEVERFGKLSGAGR